MPIVFPVAGSVFPEKANNIALKMGIKFKCSNGWLQNTVLFYGSRGFKLSYYRAAAWT
jgi:hypothetical protein